LKNKKGAKQQKFIQQVSKQVQFGGNASSRKLEAAKAAEALKKPAGDDPLAALIFKPVQKVDKGKFFHNLIVARETNMLIVLCYRGGPEIDFVCLFQAGHMR